MIVADTYGDGDREGMIVADTYGSLMPPLFSEHGGAVDSLIIILHWFMILFFIGWGIFFTYCLVRFRRRPGRAGLYKPVKASNAITPTSKYFESEALTGL